MAPFVSDGPGVRTLAQVVKLQRHYDDYDLSVCEGLKYPDMSQGKMRERSEKTCLLITTLFSQSF